MARMARFGNLTILTFLLLQVTLGRSQVQVSLLPAYLLSAQLNLQAQNGVRLASTINLGAELHIDVGASLLNVQLNNVQLGLLNGELDTKTQVIQGNMKFLLDNIQDIEGIQMQFSYINGVIENFGISEGLPAWSANILRGIASMLQMGSYTRAGEGMESDINGECPTKYSKCRNRYTKTKDLLQCTGRTNARNANLLPQRSLLKCTQTLQQDLLENVVCTEQHLIELLPISPVLATINATLSPLNLTRSIPRQHEKALLLDADLLFDLGLPGLDPVVQELLQTLTGLLENITAQSIPPTTQELTNILQASALVIQCITNLGCTEQITRLGNLLEALIEPLLTTDIPFNILMQAIGNLPSLSESLINALVGLLNLQRSGHGRAHGDQRQLIAILDSFRRDPCVPLLKQQASQILSDVSQSSPVRIQAYLATVRCLVETDLPVIQTVINTANDIDEVGSFIVSHIRNVLSSLNPISETLIQALQSLTLHDFQNSNSRNYFMESNMGRNRQTASAALGLSLDANALYSEKSAIPQCSNSNFTVAAFGRSYNLLELGICIEDFENGTQPSFSGSRYSRSTIRNITEDTDTGDMYVRLLAATIYVGGLLNTEAGIATGPLLKLVDSAVATLLKTGMTQIVPIDTVPFNNEKIMLPTISGLPLTITTEGTSILSLQITANLNVGDLNKNSKQTRQTREELGNILPMANITLRSNISLGGGLINAGLQLVKQITSLAGMGLQLIINTNGELERHPVFPLGEIPIYDVQSNIIQIEETERRSEKN